jgi:hypothetical protein
MTFSNFCPQCMKDHYVCDICGVSIIKDGNYSVCDNGKHYCLRCWEEVKYEKK